MSIFSDDAEQQCTLSRLYIPDEAHDNNVSTLQSLINFLSTFVISRLTIKLPQIERTNWKESIKDMSFFMQKIRRVYLGLSKLPVTGKFLLHSDHLSADSCFQLWKYGLYVFHKDLLSTYKCQPLVKYEISNLDMVCFKS